MKREIIIFLLLGCMNTVIGIIIILFFFKVVKLGYWASTAISYFLTSILSFFLNKRITFNNRQKKNIYIVKFVVNIGCCYFAAYCIAKPFARFVCGRIVKKISKQEVEWIALFFGIIFFTVLNFFGQKIFVFGKDEKKFEKHEIQKN